MDLFGLSFKHDSNQQGFSLVEIMIVIAIIALLAAISIPNMLRTKLNANEQAAQTTLKEISKACESYRITQPVVTYPSVIADLTDLNDQYIDASVFDLNGRRGYLFTFTAGPAAAVEGVIQTFDCAARPITANVTGNRWFVIDETGVLREDLDADGIADASDAAIQD
ncbi:MAG: prepilin-type N-terminal cleavage/methylation domain-containing protein [Candidatus Omnitrophica bacterium]|nr:prepilin-type N-terminal cleavage/methylation domain-containing protein [Candidatus Omnitrophota bacterium]